MFRIGPIDHVALTVRDVARAVAWYEDVLGLERRHQETWGDYPAMVCSGDTCLALFPAAGTAPEAAAGHRAPASLRHLAFRVDRRNFEAAQTELRTRGIGFSFENHQISESIYFQDPDGHEIELTTYELAAAVRQDSH